MQVRGTQLGIVGLHAIGEALLRNPGSRLGSLACDPFTIDETTTAFEADGLSPHCATLLAGVVKVNTGVQSLTLDGYELSVPMLKGQQSSLEEQLGLAAEKVLLQSNPSVPQQTQCVQCTVHH